MQNKDNMKKAVIKTLLECSPLKNKPNFIDNFTKSKNATESEKMSLKNSAVPKK